MLSVFLLYKCNFTTCCFLLNNILETFIFISNNGTPALTNLRKSRQEFIGPHNLKSVIDLGPAVSRVLLSVLPQTAFSSAFSCFSVRSILSLAYFFNGKIVISNSRFISHNFSRKGRFSLHSFNKSHGTEPQWLGMVWLGSQFPKPIAVDWSM